MLDHHALGAAGGAGGVNAVGEIRARGTTGERRRIERADQGPVAVHAHHRCPRVGQLAQHRLLRHEDLDLRIVEHERDAVRGIRRIHRHVRRARFVDAQDRDHHPERALATEPDQCVGTGAK